MSSVIGLTFTELAGNRNRLALALCPDWRFRDYYYQVALWDIRPYFPLKRTWRVSDELPNFL